MDFTTWYTDIWIYVDCIVIFPLLLNSKITMVCVVSWLIVISLGGCWPEVHWWWPLGKGRNVWIAYGLYPRWEGTAGFSNVCFSFLSFLVFSWCDISLHWLWKIFGRLGDWHCISPLVMRKLVAFIYIISPKYSLIYIFGRYGQITLPFQ